MMIYIGSVEKGPELADSAVHDAVTKLGLQIAKKRPQESLGQSSSLNVVFFISGSMGTPNWEGVLAAKFSKKQKLLMIQAAVPEKFVSSENIGPFLCELMRQGVIEAKPVFDRAKIPFDADKFSEFIDDIERELGWRK